MLSCSLSFSANLCSRAPLWPVWAIAAEMLFISFFLHFTQVNCSSYKIGFIIGRNSGAFLSCSLSDNSVIPYFWVEYRVPGSRFVGLGCAKSANQAERR